MNAPNGRLPHFSRTMRMQTVQQVISRIWSGEITREAMAGQGRLGWGGRSGSRMEGGIRGREVTATMTNIRKSQGSAISALMHLAGIICPLNTTAFGKTIESCGSLQGGGPRSSAEYYSLRTRSFWAGASLSSISPYLAASRAQGACDGQHERD